MSRGDKSSYTDKQKRKAEHIEDSYEQRGVAPAEAEARAWATVNKQSGGGEKSGSGRAKSPARKRADRQDSAQRAAKARRGDPQNRGAARQGGGTALGDLSVRELRDKARERDLPGRSRMRKDELIRALS